VVESHSLKGRTSVLPRIRVVAVLAVLSATGRLAPVSATSFNASLKLSKTVGPPTTALTYRGIGFEPDERVDMSFDDDLRTSVRADHTGGFKHLMTVPAPALPGDHSITAVGRDSGISASGIFLVRTDWRQSRFDALARGTNPFETVLGPETVGGMTEQWAAKVHASSLHWRIVVDGILYFGTYDGVSAADAKSGAVVWTRAIPSGVYVEIASGQGLIFVSGLFANLYALNAETGEIAWQQVTDTLFTAPTFDEGVVYVGNGNGFVYAYEASTGHFLWKSDVGIGLVYQNVVGGGEVVAIGSVIGAFDRATGHLIWKLDRTDTGNRILMSNHLVYESTGQIAIALDPGTGRLIWQNAHVPGGVIWGAPAADGDMLLIPHYDGVLNALEASTGHLLWTAQVGVLITSPSIANGVVYVAADADLVALDAATGAELFRSRVGAAGVSQPLAVVVDGVVYATDQDGILHAFSL
jgi:outer membrane protein assembly factor BamB